MVWPNPSDYQLAIQNPNNCFSDPDLRPGRPVLNPLGIPKISSGNFAVVFEMETGSKRYAVKCFTREVIDQHHRYATITRYLSMHRLPCLVTFTYRPQGVRINANGALFPLLTMEWIDGELLHQYIERHLRAPGMLLSIARAWLQTVATLAKTGVAHGDLQHRNILIAGGAIRLVDYDGMYVPELHGQPPDERGNENFQHPRRTKDDFGDHLDRFAALVIYLAIRAIAADPSLWDQFHTGENLILSRRDYEAPGKTALWMRLHASGDAEVRRLTAALEQACHGSAARVPTIDEAQRFGQAQVSMERADWQRLGQFLGLGEGRKAVEQRPTPTPSTPPTCPSEKR